MVWFLGRELFKTVTKYLTEMYRNIILIEMERNGNLGNANRNNKYGTQQEIGEQIKYRNFSSENNMNKNILKD